MREASGAGRYVFAHTSIRCQRVYAEEQSDGPSKAQISGTLHFIFHEPPEPNKICCEGEAESGFGVGMFVDLMVPGRQM
jgi:hypothetical protein